VGERTIKREIQALLAADDFDAALRKILALPPRATVNPLIGGLCALDERAKWRAVTALGQVVAAMAALEMEDARIVMRRFMWMLNDESGGIGWGVPEAMAEILSRHNGLAEEYVNILVSYLRPDGFYLEYPPLQQGLLWGIGRFAEARPDLLHKFNAVRYLSPYLESPDGAVRGLAARALGLLGARAAMAAIVALRGDDTPIRLFTDGGLTMVTTGQLAAEAEDRLA
jgi:HEAT repeat protein